MFAYRTAIIGNKDTIEGFKALGVHPYPAGNARKALETVKRLRIQTLDPSSTEKYAVIFILEDLASGIPEDEYTKVSEGALPAILVIPGLEGSRGTSLARLKHLLG